MSPYLTDVQKDKLLSILDEAMAILRDDAAFDPTHTVFGKILTIRSDPRDPGSRYDFYEPSLHTVLYKIITSSDPLNYAEDRTNIPIVPFHFEIMFDPSIINMERNLLENRLNLANYWISPLGERIEGNSIPPSNPPRMHVYRYRANPGAKSPVPVNVEIVYFDPKKDDPNGVPGLDSIRIFRAYPYLTLKELKQKREEERQKKRESYGYMNLCTGDTCPESGIWEGWTPQGPTDVLRVEKGRPFDVVRTVAINQSAAPCPMIAGQWMWLCSLEEQNGFIWNDIALKG